MKFPFLPILTVIPVILFSSNYIDIDLDGVDDRTDQCPNTPFEELVDAYGCSSSQRHHPSALLQLGIHRTSDAAYGGQTLFDFYLGSRFGAWDVSLSTVAGGSTNAAFNVEDDLFLSAGYNYRIGAVSLRPFVGTTFILSDKETVTRDNDLFGGLECFYGFDENAYLRTYYSYTVTANNPYTAFNNYHTIIFSLGYAVTEHTSAELSYQYTGAPFNGSDALHTASLYVRYALDTRYFVGGSYAYGLNDANYDHTFSFFIGAEF